MTISSFCFCRCDDQMNDVDDISDDESASYLEMTLSDQSFVDDVNTNTSGPCSESAQPAHNRTPLFDGQQSHNVLDHDRCMLCESFRVPSCDVCYSEHNVQAYGAKRTHNVNISKHRIEDDSLRTDYIIHHNKLTQRWTKSHVLYFAQCHAVIQRRVVRDPKRNPRHKKQHKKSEHQNIMSVFFWDSRVEL